MMVSDIMYIDGRKYLALGVCQQTHNGHIRTFAYI